MAHDGEHANTQVTESMIRLICGAWLSKAILVVVTLGIPDLLSDGPKQSAELAAATGTNAPYLHRLMRALAVEGVFSIDHRDRFALTALGATLRSDAHGSLRDWVLLMLGEVHQGAWDELLHSVRMGESAFSYRHSRDLWEYCRAHPVHAAMFDKAMAGFTETYIANVLMSFSFSGFRKIVDVGGGDGSLLIGILTGNPDAQGVVFELPAAAKRAQQRIVDAHLADRCVAMAGDALVEVPAGGDAYILSRVLHDWDDDHSCRFLTNCRNVLPLKGRLLVIERVVPVGPDQIASTPYAVLSDITLTDLNMMVMTSGRERTLAEYERLFEQVGLRLVRVHPTRTAMNIIESERIR
jgi:O-methyltransferase domain